MRYYFSRPVLVKMRSHRYHLLVETQRTTDHTLAELLAQLGRLAYSVGVHGGLTPAQWMALRYFSRANRFSRTMSAFAEYHATTRGTASQTVKRLVEQGYLDRTRSTTDGRSVRFRLTQKGRFVLTDDPIEALVRALGRLSPRAKAGLARSVSQLSAKLAQDRGMGAFGVCPSCRYLEGPESCREPGSCHWCALFDEPLQETELHEICVNFKPTEGLTVQH